MKYYNFSITHSHAIYASALDGFIDMISCLVNLITVYFTFLKDEKYFNKGLGKLSSLICFFQSLIVIVGSLFLIRDSFFNILNNHSEAQHLSVGIPIILLSIFMNIILVLYQKRIIEQTDSMIVKADMIHFSSDIVSHIGLFFGVLLIKFSNLYWLDSVIAIFLAFYILYVVLFVLRQSVFSILDINFITESEALKKYLLEKGFFIDKLYVYFTGTKYFIEIHNIDFQYHNLIKNEIQNSHIETSKFSACGCHFNKAEFEILFIN